MERLISPKETRTLLALLGILIFFWLILGGISELRAVFSQHASSGTQLAAAARCSNASFGSFGAIAIPHDKCLPKGETTCGPITISGVGVITTVCQNKCCKAVGYTKAPGVSLTGNSLLDAIANSAISQVVGRVVGGIFGGSSGGGSGSASGIEFANPEDEQAFLEFSTDTTQTTINTDAFSLAFGSAGIESQVQEHEATDEKQTENQESALVVRSNANAEENTDGVTTVIEELPELTTTTRQDIAPVPGETELEQDYFGASLPEHDALPGNGLSLTDLERAGKEARAREALFLEQQAAREDAITDYRSSSVNQADSPVELNPLSNTRFDELEYKNQKDEELTWWQKLVLRIGQTLGLTE